MSELSGFEKLRRRDAIEFARASVQLEGFTVSPAWIDLAEKFVQGEITFEELRLMTTKKP